VALPHIDERFIGRDIVDAIRGALADGKGGKVIDIDGDQILPDSPVSTLVEKIAHEDLVFRVDRNRRLTGILKTRPLARNKLKLGIAVRMIGLALMHFTRALEAIAGLFQ